MANCSVEGCDTEAKFHWEMRVDPPLYGLGDRYAADLCPMHEHQMTLDASVLFDAMARRNQGE